MKKFSILALLVITTIAASAQKAKTIKSQYGLKIGANTSWFNFGDKDYAGMRYMTVGFIGGVYSTISILPRWNVTTSLVYNSGGAKNPQEGNRTFSTHSITLPVSVGYKMNNFNVQAGAYFAKLLTAKNYDLYTPAENFSWPVKDWDWYQSVDYGLVFGGSWDVYNAVIEVNYNLGLNNVRRGTTISKFGDPKMRGNKNGALSITLNVPINRNLSGR